MHRQFTASSNGEEEFTVEELQEFAQAFKMFDKNGDGTMNIKELGVAMRTLGLNPTEEELLNIVNEYDADNNGKIDFGKFNYTQEWLWLRSRAGTILKITQS